LVNLISVFCIISWRIFWMTMLRRETSSRLPQVAFTSTEISLLDQLVEHRRASAGPKRELSDYITKLAQLGGYLARASDPPPGNLVIWRGLSRLNDIQLGFSLARELVGN
jgi:hypothetical protein